MKIITFNDVQELQISPSLCYDYVKEALLNKANAVLPHKLSIKPNTEGVFYNTMPVLLPFANYGGVKLVTRYPDRVPSLESQLLLYDLKTGETLALMDATWITAWRTGAVAAHSIKLLAVKDFSLLGVIGLGNTARATLLVLAELFPDKKFTVKLAKYKNQHIDFIQRFADYTNFQFICCDGYEQTVKDCDVVISAATYFDGDIVDEKSFKRGALLVPIHTRGFTSCDLTFDKIFADDTAHVSGFKYFERFKCFAEVADVLNGKKPGRENQNERIIAYNIGLALHDVYFAGKIYEQLLNKDCEEVSLESPKSKFWI